MALPSRARPYKKNDNCFVEQKNDSVVRRIVGYERFEGEDTQRVMNELYSNYDALVNYFFPSMKILSKERIDSKVKKSMMRQRHRTQGSWNVSKSMSVLRLN